MQDLFEPDFFRGNRERLHALVGDGAPIVVTANGQLQGSSDNPLPFQQDTSFWYLTGIDQPDHLLVIEGDESYIIAPARSDVQDLFDGIADHDAMRHTSGVAAVLDPTEGWARLKANLAASRRVYTLQANPAYIAVYGMYTNPARARLARRLRQAVPRLEVVDIRPKLAQLRVIKQAPEIAAIRQAIDINCATLNEVRLQSYAHEYELEADITQGFRRRGARGHSFSPIVASGLHACTFHYLENGDRLRPDDLVLVDIGTNYGQYNSDISRTWAIGKPTGRQAAVFDAVDEALMHGIEQLRLGGTSFYECEQRVRNFVGQKLQTLGLIKRIDDESVHHYYPHAPHYLGLDVHDVGDTRQPLQPGMVMTMEPGIYIPEERIGIRLEEDILITETGCEVLSRACPRELTPVQ